MSDKRIPPLWLGPGWGEVAALIVGFLVLALLFILVIGGSGCVLPAQEYVAADRATYEVVSVEYLHYVANDPDMAGPKGQSRQDLMTSWRRRLEEAEQTIEAER